ncbi:MAG: xanthine dehydrogenase family protein molybdopterin-binding subunit [Burkholderiaceae bacterium]|nr:MAG: xanthine dehydrogenase family protein molybdopterin-binding subunit [Burkholderiaceae bacterium]
MSAVSVKGQFIGHGVPRRPEILRFIKGQGRYLDDIDLPHMLHAVVLRSSHAHARILGIDATRARQMPGVVAIITPTEVGDKLRPIPVRLNPYNTLDPYLQMPLATDRVRYVGEPIALVVAATQALAEDARDQIEVDFEPLPVMTNAESDKVECALFDKAPDNVSARITSRFGDIDAVLASADEVVDFDFRTGRDSAVPLETRGLLARFDEGADRLEVWGAAKVVHFNRTVLAGMLDLPESKIRLVEPDVGGGFGARGEFYPEDFLVPFAALYTHRPVKWVEDRMEHLLAINHSRQQSYHMTLGVQRDGTLLGIKIDLVNDMGGYLRTHGIIVPEMSAGFFPGPYRWKAYACTARAVMTNKTPTGTYRCPGRFECNAARERILDVAAARLGMDPAELRRKNLIPPDAMPYSVGTHALGEDVVYDSGDYPAALAEVLRLSNYEALRSAPRTDSRHIRGVGLGCFTEKTGKGPFGGARVLVDSSGTVEVRTGASNLGQGLETSLAQIVGDVLGVDPRVIVVRHGDTDLIPFGVGSFASRATVMAGNAAYQAAEVIRDRAVGIAANAWGVAADQVRFENGAALASDGRSLMLHAIAQQSGPAHSGDPEATLDVTRYFKCDHMVYSHGAVVAEVELDRLLGKVKPLQIWVVYDVGTVINPEIVAAQVEGGAAQAVGGAFLEEFIYDDEGQLLTGSFMDFLLPTADVVPTMHHEDLKRSPSPLNPLGVKGTGEAGVAGTGAALANAVADALGRGFGDHVNQLPMTPQRVWTWAGLDGATPRGAGAADARTPLRAAVAEDMK